MKFFILNVATEEQQVSNRISDSFNSSSNSINYFGDITIREDVRVKQAKEHLLLILRVLDYIRHSNDNSIISILEKQAAVCYFLLFYLYVTLLTI